MKYDARSFGKLGPAERLAALRGERLERTFTLNRAAIDTEARTAWLSIASDAPYERWWGTEILDMRPESIRQTRLRSGAPLLVGHDSADQVGVMEDFEITTGGKLRVKARFSKSARAEEIWLDVLDGIRKNASVGYIIHDLVLERQEEDVSIYRVTDWEPMEGSLVAVPADPTVGIGRSITHLDQGKNMKPEDRSNPVASAMGAAQTSADGERHRILSLVAAGDAYRDLGGVEIAQELIKDPTATEATFKARMIDRMSASSQTRLHMGPAADREAYYGEAGRVGFRYGKLKAFEREEDAHRVGMWIRGNILGKKEAARWCVDHGVGTRDMSEGILSAGGATVPVEMASQYIRLVELYGVFRRNARIWPMGSDMLKIARRKTGLTAYVLGENAAATEADQGWDNVTLSAEKFGVMPRVSNELIEDSAIALADSLMLDIALAFSTIEDQCGFIGDGTSTYGGMSGLTNIMIDGNHNAGKIVAATAHKTWATLDVPDLTNLMSALPLYARKNAKWYCSSVAWDRTFSRLMAAAGGNRLDTLTQEVQLKFLGHPAEISQVLPNGATTDYSNKVMILFGDLSMSSAMGTRRELQIRVDQSRFLDQDQTAFMATERFDIVNHNCGDNTNAGPVVALIGTT